MSANHMSIVDRVAALPLPNVEMMRNGLVEITAHRINIQCVQQIHSHDLARIKELNYLIVLSEDEQKSVMELRKAAASNSSDHIQLRSEYDGRLTTLSDTISSMVVERSGIDSGSFKRNELIKLMWEQEKIMWWKL